MWVEGDANFTHRCPECHGLIRKVLETALTYTKMETGITDDLVACQDPHFVNVGRQVLAMDLDQLKGAKL